MSHPRFVWALALGCVGWQLVARTGQFYDDLTYLSLWTVPSAVVGTVAITGLVGALLLLATGRGPRRALLALMVVLTFVPAPIVGAAWPMVAGLLAAAVLLTIRAPASLLAFGLITAVDATLAWVLGDEGLSLPLGRAHVTVIVGVTLFAVVWLAQRVEQSADARAQLARAEAEAERLRSAARLRLALGTQLSRLLQRLHALAVTPSRAGLAEAAELARHASASAREIVTDRNAVPTPGAPAAAGPPPMAEHRLAWWVSVLLVLGYAGLALVNVAWAGDATATVWAAATATVVVTGALHLYHGTPRTDGGDPRWWPWTLSAQVVLLLAVTTLVVPGPALLVLWILAGGAVVTRVHGPWSWLFLVSVYALFAGVHALTAAWWNGWTAVYFAGAFLIGVATVYALCNLPGVARQLHATRSDVVRAGIAAQRLRFARDVHDLLGFHLAAVSVKAELAARALDGGPGTVGSHLDDMRGSIQRALAEIRTIDDAAAALDAAAELVAARRLLEAADIEVTIDAPPAGLADVDHLVGIIVREAATNVMRHASADWCAIQIAIDGTTVGVRISNDGVAALSGPPREGSGIANLAARARAAGGRVTTTRDRDTFTLSAQLPARRVPAEKALMDPAHPPPRRSTTLPSRKATGGSTNPRGKPPRDPDTPRP